MTYRELYSLARGRLKEAEISTFDAACIFEKNTGISRDRLPFCGEEIVPAGQEAAVLDDLARRLTGEPLQYILGEWEFMGLRFQVGPGVLIPRPETELLAETAVEFLRKKNRPVKFLELCAGSGCVTATILRNVPGSTAVCIELSQAALPWLHKNLELTGCAARAQVIEGDILTCSLSGLEKCFDAVVCNPPYIRSDEIPDLQTEVKDHEPRLALDGGVDGLRFYRAFARWRETLVPGGLAALEVGQGQAGEVASLLAAAGFGGVFIRPDLSGIDRVVGGFAVP